MKNDNSIIEDEALIFLGIDPQKIDFNNPDQLIKLYRLTYFFVSNHEINKINQDLTWAELNDGQRNSLYRKKSIWMLRWHLAYRLPRILSVVKKEEEDISRFVDWIHKELVKKYEFKLSEKGPKYLSLDRDILGQFFRGLWEFETFNENTWPFLFELYETADLRDESVLHYIILLGKVYEKYKQPTLKKFLEISTMYQDIGTMRSVLAKAAPAILQGKKLKIVHPPYQVGLAFAK